MIFKKAKDGSLILSVTTDRKFNILSEEVIESKESIDYSLLAACLAEKYIELNEEEAETAQ